MSLVDPYGLVFFTLTTTESAKRDTSIDEAVRRGAWTRAVTLPAVGVALTPNAIGLLSSPAMCFAEGVVLSQLTLEELKQIIGKRGVELFRELFKDPSSNPGLTQRQLEAYKEIARRIVERYKAEGKSPLGIETQTERIDIINKFLK
ncbi:hypothetical protein [Roseateles sp. L2-2]|uniref:hypothetical protein n=1 Tax=Roseateles sp. L2-2 TaxID=3422597 RepID=UPI003D36A8BD